MSYIHMIYYQNMMLHTMEAEAHCSVRPPGPAFLAQRPGLFGGTSPGTQVNNGKKMPTWKLVNSGSISPGSGYLHYETIWQHVENTLNITPWTDRTPAHYDWLLLLKSGTCSLASNLSRQQSGDTPNNSHNMLNKLGDLDIQHNIGLQEQNLTAGQPPLGLQQTHMAMLLF